MPLDGELHSPPAIPEIVAHVRATRTTTDGPLTIAIDGVDGVGKTTFAAILSDALRADGTIVRQASIDDFHFQREVRYRRGRRDPRGYLEDSFDHAAFCRLVLDPLAGVEPRLVRLRHHDVKTDEILDEPRIEIGPDDILVVDGVFLQTPMLRGRWGLVIFLDAPFEATVPRAIERDCTEDRHERDQATDLAHTRYVPGQAMYLTEHAPRDSADILVDYTDPATARVVRTVPE